MNRGSYSAIISSDWNECLAPTGPFDPIVFHHPALKAQVQEIFKEYTGNRIRLGEHVWRGKPEPETMPTWHRADLIPFAAAV